MRTDRIYEQSTGHAKSMKLETLNEIAKSICKIDIKGIRSSGFFLKIGDNEKPIYMLVTANHVIPKKLVEIKKKIKIIPDIGNLEEEITLNSNERKIICLEDKDVSAVEIIEKDKKKNKVKFLNYDTSCNNLTYGNYLGVDTFILHHPNGEDLECNSGRIFRIKDPKIFEFVHTLDTQKGSSGSPILLFPKVDKEPNVIGIHTSFVEGKSNNIGTFIDVLIDDVKNNYFVNNNNKFELPKKSKILIMP